MFYKFCRLVTDSNEHYKIVYNSEFLNDFSSSFHYALYPWKRDRGLVLCESVQQGGAIETSVNILEYRRNEFCRRNH